MNTLTGGSATMANGGAGAIHSGGVGNDSHAIDTAGRHRRGRQGTDTARSSVSYTIGITSIPTDVPAINGTGNTSRYVDRQRVANTLNGVLARCDDRRVGNDTYVGRQWRRGDGERRRRHRSRPEQYHL
jgi:hypothetical protein